MMRILLSAVLFFSMPCVFAQVNQSSYFSYPLSVPPKLNANFGEMRPNHFHMGLDLNTLSRENLPVYAPADGFISRMKIETGGFGRAIYLDHPNGTTTLYAHMNRFIPTAEKYLEDQQYQQKTWKIDLTVPPNRFPVKKGQLIGYSGNTGASQGPHVHFEIRDTKTENCLNPLRFGLPPVDVTPPDLHRLVFYDRSKSLYEQTPHVYHLIKKGNSYTPSTPVELPFEQTFIAIQATDRVTGAPNANGIFRAILTKNDKPINGFELENISYDKTRYLNGHIDHAHRMRGGAYYQMMFPPKHFDLPIYQNETKYLDVPEVSSSYEIDVFDTEENKSTISFTLKQKAGTRSSPIFPGAQFLSGMVNVYEDDEVQFVFDEHAFYDDFHFNLQKYFANSSTELSSTIHAMPEFVPVQTYFSLRIKPNRNIALIDPDRLVIRRQLRTRTEIKKAVLEKGWAAASFRELGSFQLLQDLIPPSISTTLRDGAGLVNGSRISFFVTDNLKEIQAFSVEVDGQWLLFKPSGSNFNYTVDQHFPEGEHLLTAVVKDEAGNETVRSYRVTKK